MQSSLSSLRSDESRLRLFFDRLHLSALIVITFALLIALLTMIVGSPVPVEVTQMVVFFVAAGIGLLTLALAGRTWLGKQERGTSLSLVAIVLSALMTYQTGGTSSVFAGLPVLIASLDTPFHTERHAWRVAGAAAIALAIPLSYDFSYWYLRLTLFGWIFIVTLTGYSTGIVGTLTRKRTETSELAALARASALTTTLDLEATLSGTVSLITDLLEPHACVLYLVSPDRASLTPSHSYFEPTHYSEARAAAVRVTTAAWGTGFIGTVARDQVSLISYDVSRDERAVHIAGTGNDPATYLVIPLVFNEETLGVLRVSRDGANQYSNDDLTLATIFANQAAVAIANARLYEQTRQAEQAARESEQHYVRLTRNAGEVIMQFDPSGRQVTAINEAGEQILGYAADQFSSRPGLVAESLDEVSRSALDRAIEQIAGGTESVRDVVLTWSNPEGRIVILDHVLIPLRDALGALTGIETIARDITERHRLESAIRELTFTDQLTGIANRTFFEQEVRRVDAERYLPLTVIMGDVNGLKLVNDAFGHAVGDKLLADAARLLGSALRRSDVLCRWGGDEFAIILPNVDERSAEEIMARIRSTLAKAEPNPIAFSVALGVCTRHDLTTDLATVIREAEERMYRSKLYEAKGAQRSLIESLEKSLWQKTDETREHTQRVQATCRILADELGLSEDKTSNLATFALLHDVGKVAIGGDVFRKAGTLSHEEWLAVKRHPEIGYRIALANSRLMPIAELILSHHEHWDGSGYPRGLAAEEIPLLARVLAVADAYDVMVTGKPYRPALSEGQALAEIAGGSGTQFDPAVVAALIRRMQMRRTTPAAAAGQMA